MIIIMYNYMCICALIIISEIISSREVFGQTCEQIRTGKQNINKRLTGFKIAEKTVAGIHECARECMFLTHCKSFNFGQDDNVCEVNHADSSNVVNIETVERYIYSDISAWPKTMVGSCAEHTCSGTQRCVPTAGNFICMNTACDDPPKFDNALVQPGPVTLGAIRTYEFVCPLGMITYGTSEVTCGLDFKWSPLDKGCRVLQTCSDVKVCNPSYTDGEYWMYPEAMGGHKIKVFCSGMPTEAPSEYVSVNPAHNHAYDPGTGNGVQSFTTYTKIRVNIETMEIIRTDTKFADSTGYYAEAVGCNCVGGCQPWKGYFNTSTVGTGLKFSDQITLATWGYQPGISGFKQNADRTRMWAHCGGNCGGCYPNGPFHLYYNENEVVDEGMAINPVCD